MCVCGCVQVVHELPALHNDWECLLNTHRVCGCVQVVHELHLPGRDTPLRSPPMGRAAVLQLRQPLGISAAGGGCSGGSGDGGAAPGPPAPDPWLYVDDIKLYKAMVTELSRWAGVRACVSLCARVVRGRRAADGRWMVSRGTRPWSRS